MSKSNHLSKTNHEKNAISLWREPSYRCYPQWICTKWRIVCLVFTLILCFTISAEAGMVYGHLYGAEGYFQPSDTFTLTDEKGNRFSVTTDENKGYSITIPPRIYKVEFKKGGAVWEAWIQSLPDAVGQDIYLQKVR
jgi:hypothetical protein